MASFQRSLVASSVNATGTNLTGLNITNGTYTIAFWAKGPISANGDVFRHSSTANSARDGYTVYFFPALRVQHYTATATTTYTAIGGSEGFENIWKHYMISYNGTHLLPAVNGTAFARVAAANQPTGNALCTTSLISVSGAFTGLLFDLQIIPNVSVPIEQARLLMNPTFRHPDVKARWFGREFIGVGVSSTLRDESGNGNNLTTGAGVQLPPGEEPPIRPTFA